MSGYPVSPIAGNDVRDLRTPLRSPAGFYALNYTLQRYAQSGEIRTQCTTLLFLNQGNTNVYLWGGLLLAPGSSFSLPNDLGAIVGNPIDATIEQTAADGVSDPNPDLAVVRGIVMQSPRP